MANQELSEQEIVRRRSLEALRERGIDPYPAAEYPVSGYSREIKENFDDNLNPPREVSVAGRIMSRRIMGKASFMELQDSEGRIQIYVSRDIFLKRTKMFNSMREYFNSFNYTEVETPILQSIPGGAAARPFITHHNALDIPLYLRIADELYLKRLIVGGFEGVYEFSKNFRNEGMDRTHNPEFTCMEIYVPYKDYNWMMDFTEKMLEKIALYNDSAHSVRKQA